MVCQSDYDKLNQASLRQVDECVEEWWKPGERLQQEPVLTRDDPEQEVETAQTEAVRRGLLRQDERVGLCVSCPEGDG